MRSSSQFYQQPQAGKALKYLLWTLGVVFIFQLSFRQFGGFAVERFFGFVPEEFVAGKTWQVLSYSFLHGGLLHLLFNALFLYMLGAQFERRWGSKNFLKYYCVCAIGGALLHLLIWALSLAFFPSASSMLGSIPIIGASGAAYGFFMAFGLLYAEQQVLVFFMIPMKAKNFVLLLTGVSIFSAVFYSTPEEGGGVAHLVHLGGLLTGFLYLKFRGPNLDGHGGLKIFKAKTARQKRKLRAVIIDKDGREVDDKGEPIIWN